MERGVLSLNTSTINTTSIGEITLSSPNARFKPIQKDSMYDDGTTSLHSMAYGKYVPILVSNI